MGESGVPLMERPVLTFPPEVAEWVRERYAAAEVILEYGSGGSTVLAAEMPGKTVFSVESDKSWAEGLAAFLAAGDFPSKVRLHHVDVGPTGKWGMPVDRTGLRRYHRYPISVWERPDFVQPDLVLIDGRFRLACALSTMLLCTRPVTVLFDDYVNRPGYHAIERFLDVTETRGRMARFEVEPQALPRDGLSVFAGAFAIPN